MFEIKSEVETYTGKKIDISKQIDQVQREAKQRGQKISDAHIKQIKKDFKKQDKKHKHKAVYFAQCMEADIPFTSLEADRHFENIYMAKSAHGKNDQDIDVPITITVGVTLSLCGYFLLVIPNPICTACGWYLLDAGMGILGSEALTRWDQYNRDQKVKK
jgi:hypothetical protein